MHVVDDAADALGERDRGPCPFDVGAQAGDERLSARGQNMGGGRHGFIE